MTRFHPSSKSSAAVSAERRLTLLRSMGIAARENDHRIDFHLRSKK
jgi:hypothetical protein